MEETNRQDEIECPYCGKIDIDVCDCRNGNYECSYCGKISDLNIEVTTNFIATPDCELNGEKHIFFDSPVSPDIQLCKKCNKMKIKK